MEIEHEVRRRYNKKWKQVVEDKRNSFYKSQTLNDELNKIPPTGRVNKNLNELHFPIFFCFRIDTAYKYTNQGDSYFVSEKMYKALMGTCRCGREKKDGHLLKCLQKEKDLYLVELEENKSVSLKKIPATSFGKQFCSIAQ